MTDAAELFRFGECELRPARQELLRRGQAQPLPPKAFDLLVHLVRHRDRAVPKAELLDVVWSAADVSDNVIARAVMKVRRAIGDDIGEPVLLRTVHRIGYRFHGEPPQALAAAPGPDTEAVPWRIAFLPTSSPSADTSLARAVWDVPAIAAQALALNERLSIIGMDTVQQALALVEHTQNPETAAQQLAERIGANCVVHASLRRSSDRLRLDYRLLGRHEATGSLRAPNLEALGHALAAAVMQALFPDARLNELRPPYTDPLVSQALGRAQIMSAAGRWDVVARLLRIVLDFNPEDLYARLQLLRALANLDDPAALAVGQALLIDAEAADNTRLIAAVHEGLGRALFNVEAQQAGERSRWHLDQALRLSRPFEHEDWVIRVYLGQAIAAHADRELTRARRFYDLALRANERAGNKLRQAAILSNRAVLDFHAGHLLMSRERAERSLALCDRFGLVGNGVDALTCLALAESGLGLYRRAATRLEMAIERLPTLPAAEATSGAWVLLLAGQIDFEWPSARLSARAFQAAPPLAEAVLHRVRAAQSAAEAYRAANLGDAAGADGHFVQAIDAARESGYAESLHAIAGWRLITALRLAGPAAAAQAAATVQALPGLHDDPALQALLLRAEAAQACAGGDLPRAQRLLAGALRLAPWGMARALAGIDAAWLHLAADEAQEAERCVAGLEPWLAEHPAGLALGARMAYAAGRYTEAEHEQQVAVLARGPRASRFFVALTEAYAASAECGAARPLPDAPGLLTDC